MNPDKSIAPKNVSHGSDKDWFRNAIIKSSVCQINWRVFLQQYEMIRDEAEMARTKIRVELLKRGIIKEKE